MSFISRNHPQQVAVKGAADHVDDRWTPLNLWIPWNDRWEFTLDVAASDDNHLCDRYFTLEMNSGCELVVMLAPANRTEQRWWQEYIEPHREHPAALIPLRTIFLPRRINFGSRDNLGAWSASSAPFGCVLLIWSASHEGTPGAEEPEAMTATKGTGSSEGA